MSWCFFITYPLYHSDAMVQEIYAPDYPCYQIVWQL
jgi:hypothetical protein